MRPSMIRMIAMMLIMKVLVDLLAVGIGNVELCLSL